MTRAEPDPISLDISVQAGVADQGGAGRARAHAGPDKDRELLMRLELAEDLIGKSKHERVGMLLRMVRDR